MRARSASLAWVVAVLVGWIGWIASGPIAGQSTVIKGIDPISKQTRDLGDLGTKLDILQASLAAIQGQLRSVPVRTAAFGRPLDVNVKWPIAFTDPCSAPNKQDKAISQTASTIIVTGRAGMRIAICQLRIVAGAAEITSELEGTGSACGTGTIVHSGSATAANGESFAANGGYQSGGANATVILTNTGNDFCIGQSGSNRVAGKVQYVYIP